MTKIISARFSSIFDPDPKARLSARFRYGRERNSRAGEESRKIRLPLGLGVKQIFREPLLRRFVVMY